MGKGLLTSSTGDGDLLRSRSCQIPVIMLPYLAT